MGHSRLLSWLLCWGQSHVGLGLRVSVSSAGQHRGPAQGRQPLCLVSEKPGLCSGEGPWESQSPGGPDFFLPGHLPFGAFCKLRRCDHAAALGHCSAQAPNVASRCWGQ